MAPIVNAAVLRSQSTLRYTYGISCDNKVEQDPRLVYVRKFYTDCHCDAIDISLLPKLLNIHILLDFKTTLRSTVLSAFWINQTQSNKELCQVMTTWDELIPFRVLQDIPIFQKHLLHTFAESAVIFQVSTYDFLMLWTTLQTIFAPFYHPKDSVFDEIGLMCNMI